MSVGLDVVWRASFKDNGAVYKENLAYLVPDGVLIAPNKNNTTNSARPNALPTKVESVNGKNTMFVLFGGQYMQVLGIVHSHPNRSGSPYPLPDVDYIGASIGVRNFVISHYQIQEAYLMPNGSRTGHRRVGVNRLDFSFLSGLY